MSDYDFATDPASLSAVNPTGFDLGLGPQTPIDVVQPLTIARAVMSGLAGKINQHVTNEMANNAVTANLLSNGIEQSIRTDLGNAAQSLLTLYGPIESDITGHLGSAVEGALKLGVVPPNPNNPGVMPVAVQIREAGNRGDIGPALAAYRETALPTAQYPGLEYARAVQSITSALPPIQSVQDSFALASQAMASQPVHGNVSLSAGVDPQGECLANAAAQFNANLQSIVGLQMSDPVAYGQQAAKFQQQYMEAIAACGQMGGGLGGVGGIGGPGSGQPGGGSGGVFNPRPPPGGLLPGTGPLLPGGTGLPPGGIVPRPGPGLPQPGAPPSAPLPGGPMPAGPPGGPGPGSPRPGPGSGLPVQPPPVGGGAPGAGGPSQPGGGGSSQGGGGGNGGNAGDGPATGLPNVPDVPPGSGGITAGPAITNVPPPPPTTPPGGTGGGTLPGGQGCVDKNGESWSIDRIASFIRNIWQTRPVTDSSMPELFAQTGILAVMLLSGVDCSTVVPGAITVPVSGLDPRLTPNGSSTVYYCATCPTAAAAGKDCCCPPQTINVTVQQPQPPKPPAQQQAAPAQQGAAGPLMGQAHVQGCDQFGPAPTVRDMSGYKDLAKILGLESWDGTPFAFDESNPITYLFSAIANNFLAFIRHGVNQFGAAADSVAQGAGCINDDMIGLSATAVVTQLFNKYVGNVLDPIDTPNQQQRNYICPTKLPDQTTAASAWLANTIDDKTLECWTRAAGYKFPEWKTVVDAARQKFPITQLGSLFLRGILNDQQLNDRVREAGFTLPSDISDLKELLKVIPPPSDLVRFMVRDTGDAALVQKFGMDDDFQQKFSQQLQDWAKASGVSDEYMQHVWRAHWQIPSPGQLFDMLHRSSEVDPTDERYTSLDDVKTALEQQDILPYWIPKILNASYRVMSRIDLRRGYQLGVIDDDQLITKLQTFGYSEKDAGTLQQVAKATTLATFLRNPVVGQFANGWLSDDDFATLLKGDGATQEVVDSARSRAILIASEKTRKRCTDAYRKRYLLGDLSRDDAQSNLVSLAIPADLINAILAGWDCERDAGGKSIPAGELAALYSQGAIDQSGLVNRLKRLGYAFDDAVLLGRRIAKSNQQRIDKLEQQAIDKQAREEAAAARSEAAAQRQAAAQLQRNANKAAALVRVNTLRDKRLNESGRSFSAHSGTDLPAAIVDVKSLYRELLLSGLYLPDEIIGAIITATQDKAITTVHHLRTAVMVMLTA